MENNSEAIEQKNNTEKKQAPEVKDKYEGKEIYIERFDPFSRFLHLLVIISFLSLAITGMVIKFSDVGIFQLVSEILGGYKVTGVIHRFAAVITFIYFGLHVGYLIRKKKNRKISFKNLLSGENSLIPTKQDLKELIQTFKWFVGLGPRPQYGRWTYWEKFDYFAVFWGVMVIGSSGLFLWFPEFFTGLGIPGWLINVATIIHSDEALLAVGFIFTVHFFNTHLRPDKFPMDTVIFTGSVPLEEMKYDRPREYQLLKDTNQLESKIVEAPPKRFLRIARIFGFTAFTTGLIIIILIIYSMIFVYQ
jgi:cytochrome b subunit of formate dehydrogenase